MHLQGRAEESRGKCPFEPTLKYAAVFVGAFSLMCSLEDFLLSSFCF